MDISNGLDIIDSRDIVARIEELEKEGRDKDALEELATLQALVSVIDDSSGDSAEDGVTLVRDSYFEDYARELADDIGAVDKNASWPNNCIDWQRAAEELQMDYTSLEFDGVTYWCR